jgi:hypothetical protein
MSLFQNILEKLGLKKPAATTTATTTKSKVPEEMKPKLGQAIFGAAAVSKVDVVTKLEGLAAKNPGLNWKESIVDLLKLLGLDSSFNARKAMATELGCPANLMGDSAAMNTWLHKTVLQKIAENGGNIPSSLLN